MYIFKSLCHNRILCTELPLKEDRGVHIEEEKPVIEMYSRLLELASSALAKVYSSIT